MKKYKVTADATRPTGHREPFSMIVEAENADKAKSFVLNHAPKYSNGPLYIKKVEEQK